MSVFEKCTSFLLVLNAGAGFNQLMMILKDVNIMFKNQTRSWGINILVLFGCVRVYVARYVLLSVLCCLGMPKCDCGPKSLSSFSTFCALFF